MLGSITPPTFTTESSLYASSRKWIVVINGVKDLSPRTLLPVERANQLYATRGVRSVAANPFFVFPGASASGLVVGIVNETRK
jgi:hypothetical protein